jgi:hypothetical protein
MRMGDNMSRWRGCVRMCQVAVVGRGLVMLGEDEVGWVNLSEIGKSLLSFGEVV